MRFMGLAITVGHIEGSNKKKDGSFMHGPARDTGLGSGQPVLARGR